MIFILVLLRQEVETNYGFHRKNEIIGWSLEAYSTLAEVFLNTGFNLQCLILNKLDRNPCSKYLWNKIIKSLTIDTNQIKHCL